MEKSKEKKSWIYTRISFPNFFVQNGEIFPGKLYMLTILVKLELQGTLWNIFIHKCCVKQSQTLSVENSFKNDYVHKLLLNDGSFGVGKHSWLMFLLHLLYYQMPDYYGQASKKWRILK